jgi:hypothetical protein
VTAVFSAGTTLREMSWLTGQVLFPIRTKNW